MSARRAFVAALAVTCAVAVAIASLLVPGLLATVAPTWLVPPPDARSEVAAAVLPLVGVGGALAAGVAALRVRSTAPEVGPMLEEPVEAGDTDAVATVGRRFRQQQNWAASEWQRPEGSGERSREFEGRLREAATLAYASAVGVDDATARHAVETGAWTDDPVAAWFLSTPDADVPIPLTTWLWSRLRPADTYRSCVERTTDAIDDLGGDR